MHSEKTERELKAMTKPGAYVGEILLLYLGVVACATSVIFIKQSTVHPALVPAYRLAIASLLMAPALYSRGFGEIQWPTDLNSHFLDVLHKTETAS